ncbi:MULTISPECIES: MFS transporter [unclassified Phenylobacterium]|uniref:MFS transporter n=1 Tax=unclassified Phenylobacterium TaxID=2640670 RepID=UPI000ADA700C|nr:MULTISPECIES: MFS transporter [unclassified Phenylobacterium]
MSGEPAQHRPPKTLVTLVLGLGQIVAFASSYYLMGALGDPIARDLGLAPTLIFALTSASLAVSPILSPAAGRWIDRSGGKVVLLVSNLIFASALVLLARAADVAGLTLAMAALGVGMTIGMYGTPFAILVALYGEEARRPITGVAVLGGLGSAVGWPVTAWMAETMGWRGACLAWAAAHLLVCLPLVVLVTPRVVVRPRDAASPPAAPVVWDRRMIQLATIFACAWFISSAMANHMPRLLAGFGLTPSHAAAVAGLVGLAAVGVRLAEFTVLRRVPILISTRLATLLHPLGATALVSFGAKAAPLMALGQGGGNGMMTVAKGVLPLSLFGQANYGYRSALLSQPAQVLQVGGPALYGMALAESPTAALGLSSALCLVMFAMTFGLQNRSQPQKEHAAA